MLQLLGQIVILFVMGLIIGYFFRFSKSTVYHAPSSTSVKQKIVERDGKCYRLEPEIKICPIKWLG